MTPVRRAPTWAALLVSAALGASACAPLNLDSRTEATVKGHVGGGERHTSAGVDVSIAHRGSDGVRSGLFAGYMRSDQEIGFFGEPGQTVNFAGVSPWVGYEVRGFQIDGGLTVYVGHLSDVIGFPIPWVAMRFGAMDTAWFEMGSGPDDGLWSTALARLGAGGRFGSAQLRGGTVFAGFVPEIDSRDEFGIELEGIFGLYADLRWTHESGWGFAVGGVWMLEELWQVTAGIAIDLHTVFSDD